MNSFASDLGRTSSFLWKGMEAITRKRCSWTSNDVPALRICASGSTPAMASRLSMRRSSRFPQWNITAGWRSAASALAELLLVQRRTRAAAWP